MAIIYPPEWAKQKTVWLSFPHNSGEWSQVDTEDPLQGIKSFYRELVEKILDYQNLSLVFNDEELYEQEKEWTKSLLVKKNKLEEYLIPNNDIWIRDYGPFFMLEDGVARIYDFQFNAWGGKFPPWDLDNQVPMKLAERLGYERREFEFILEGGALEFNGAGVIMTTKQCLLNQNRNPDHSQEEIEELLKDTFCVEKIIWLERGLEGDHTDGHIDDFARFISEKKILLCQTKDKENPNYQHLQESKKELENLGYELDFLPLPKDMKRSQEYLPASYANFIFLNGAVLIPSFNCAEDEEAFEIFKRNFPERQVLTIDASLLIQEGGALHCMTKQEPY